MKEKINIKLASFNCDECNRSSGQRPELDSHNYNGIYPFPYNLGWIFVCKLVIKVSEESSNGTIYLLNKHFCSYNCLDKYICLRIGQALYNKIEQKEHHS